MNRQTDWNGRLPDTPATSAVGSSLPRVGGIERVTGTQRYGADLRLEHALQVKLVHLDCARARILSVDRRAAAEIPGVRCIMTADDLPQPVARYGPNYSDRPILAVGETKFFGEPVVAIAAESDDAANAAALTIRIEYEELRPVLTIDQARDPASPLVQDPDIR